MPPKAVESIFQADPILLLLVFAQPVSRLKVELFTNLGPPRTFRNAFRVTGLLPCERRAGLGVANETPESPEFPKAVQRCQKRKVKESLPTNPREGKQVFNDWQLRSRP
jgi:hypothetical protein